MRKLPLLIVTLITFFSSPLRADVVVLLHGFMGSPSSYEKSGINNLLESAGWGRAGIIIPDMGEALSGRNPDAENVAYLVDLPWMLPLRDQAQYFGLAMDRIITERPNEPITLVGHSVGGVVERYWLVTSGGPNVTKLITIASPHSGTQRATDALRLTNPVIYPVDQVRNFFGGDIYNTVRRSRALIKDLTPPQKSRRGNALTWLNTQPHPNIKYISIVREDRFGLDRDWLVSADSQDMNFVPALAGRSETMAVPAGHDLTLGDGKMIAALLLDEAQQIPQP